VEAKYSVGQRVVIRPLSEPGPTHRENDISRYAGHTGVVTDFYWISPRAGQLFYIYHVRVGKERKEVVIYEDEMEPYLS
jgi:ribosomal protein L21E